MLDYIAARVLDQFGIAAPFAKRCEGRMLNLAKSAAGDPKIKSHVERD